MALSVMIFSHRGRKHFLKHLFRVTNLAEGKGKKSKDIRVSMKIVNTFWGGDKTAF